jgi:hypothetical protein
MIKTQRIMWVKKYVSNDIENDWKKILDYYLKDFGGKFLFLCNYDVSKLKLSIPNFYKECIYSWSNCNTQNSDPCSLKDICNQFLWNNKRICINKTSIFMENIYYKGVQKIGHLYDQSGTLLLKDDNFRSNFSPLEFYTLFSLYKALPVEWHKLLKENQHDIANNTVPINPINFKLNDISHEIDVLNLKSKSVYEFFIRNKAEYPTAKYKYENTDNNRETLDWKKIYLLPFKTTFETKLREFQYKILNRILPTNNYLFKIGLSESPICFFCKDEVDQIEHMFYECKIVRTF